MRTFNGQIESFRQFCDTARMIDMRVGNENLLQGNTILFDCAQNVIEITARIDDRALASFRAPKYRAILLKRCDRYDHAAQSVIGILFFTHNVGE